MERTPWFDATMHKPVRAGWYEAMYSGAYPYIFRAYWDGKQWAKRTPIGLGLCAGDRWRGLTRPADDGGGR